MMNLSDQNTAERKFGVGDLGSVKTRPAQGGDLSSVTRPAPKTSQLSQAKREKAYQFGQGVRDELSLAGATRRAMATANMTRQAVEDRKARTGYKPKEPEIPAFGSFFEGLSGKELSEPSPTSTANDSLPHRPYGVMKSDGDALESVKAIDTGLGFGDLKSLGGPKSPLTPIPGGEPYNAVMPTNDDSLAAAYLRSNSQPADKDLNAGHRKAVPGLDGVSYAGKYGKTDVFAGVTYDENGNKVTNFSDLANLATTRGGAAAAVPEGKTAVTNTSPEALYGLADVNRDGLPDQTSPELQAARKAAIERGDLSAVERSYMNSRQRAAQDAQRKREDLRDAAIQRDPVATYAVDQDSLAAAGRLLAQRDKDLEATTRADQRDARSAARLNDQRIASAWRYLEPQLVGLTQKASHAVQGVLGTVAKDFPGLDGISLSQKVIEQLKNPSSSSSEGIDPDTLNLIGANF